MNLDWNQPYQIIDISQPVGETTACFPGDTPFARKVTVSYAESRILNLSQFTMSPHVGTHADAPVHIKGDMATDHQWMIGEMPLDSFMGPAQVVDVSLCTEAILPQHLEQALGKDAALQPRLLFRTRRELNWQTFENDYAWFSPELIQMLSGRGVKLVGLDTPSVDHVDSKDLPAHHALDAAGMVWLENLDLTRVLPGNYVLLAQPLKMVSLEASPVRAVLIMQGMSEG